MNIKHCKSRLFGIFILLIGTVLCLLLAMRVPKLNNDIVEQQIQNEIKEREESEFKNIYEQLKLQDGLEYYDEYKKLASLEIEYFVREKYR